MGMLEKISQYSELWQKEVLEKKEKTQKNKLKRDKEGKPMVKLTPLEETVVNTPTQEDYNTLLQVYECGNWRLPSEPDYWNRYNKETCIMAGRIFEFSPRHYYQLAYKILSTQEFYNKQKITKSMINEIKNYFENKK